MSVQSITEKPPLPARALAQCLRWYSLIAPTGRGSYRLTRGARFFYPTSHRSGVFETREGLRLRLDLSTYPDCSMAFGLYELETARAICRLLSPGDTFIDVGANIGYFSTLAAKRVGSAGNVHAFEPSPANRSRLVENVNINMLGPVVNIHAEALSDYNGELHLHEYCVAGANHGQATAFPLAHRTRVTHACAVRLDDLLPHLTPRLVKLDVEGSELAAIMGMRSMLARAAPALIVEINPVTCKVANFSPSDLVSAILSVVPNHGCWLLRGRPKRIDPTPHELDPLGEVNLLFDLPERCPCS